jgi:5,10-methylenetetrahydromethanopterin reductase
MAECIGHARFCDEQGFDSVWVAEGRLTRDGIVPAAAIAYATKRIKVGTGVVNNKTRNPALMAVTFKTLAELAPHRVNLGIGPWWEPLASRVGTPLHKPVQEMREYLTVVKALFRNETVNFEGAFIRVRDIRFDMMYRENQPVDVPIYIGAVGPRMLELAGEIADGVLLDFMVPPSYVRNAVDNVKKGIARRVDGVQMIDLPSLWPAVLIITILRQPLMPARRFSPCTWHSSHIS